MMHRHTERSAGQVAAARLMPPTSGLRSSSPARHPADCRRFSLARDWERSAA
jgi:hypothetical protein